MEAPEDAIRATTTTAPCYTLCRSALPASFRTCGHISLRRSTVSHTGDRPDRCQARGAPVLIPGAGETAGLPDPAVPAPVPRVADRSPDGREKPAVSAVSHTHGDQRLIWISTQGKKKEAFEGSMPNEFTHEILSFRLRDGVPQSTRISKDRL